MAMKQGYPRDSPLYPHKNYSTILSYSSTSMRSIIALTMQDIITFSYVGRAIYGPALGMLQSK
jgi:hypothetical protein